MVNSQSENNVNRVPAKKYRGQRRKKGILYLSGKRMKKCRKEIKYSDKTIKRFIERVAKPSLRGKKFIGKVYKGHMTLLLLNYCAAQYSEKDLKSNFNIKRESSLKNMKIGAREFAWFIRTGVWNPKITSEFKNRSKYSYDNFGNVKGEDFRHCTLNIDGKPVRAKKFKRTDSEGNKLNGKQLNKYWYDDKLKAPGKRFIALKTTDGKWRGCSKTCYPSGKFKEGRIIKSDPYCKKWFTLMNERDCVAADSGIGPSIRLLLENPDEHYLQNEGNPTIDETKVNYPPVCRTSYTSEVQTKLKKIKKSHIKFGKMNIERGFGQLVNKNPGILSKHNAFRTDDGVFLSNLVQTSMEMQNIEEEFTDEELQEKESDYMMKLYNGKIDFEEPEEVNEVEVDEGSDNEEENENPTNIEQILNMFGNTKRDLLQQFEENTSQSQSQTQTQGTQTN